MPTAELESRTVSGLRASHPSAGAVLVQRMRAGDQGAFEEIFRRHHAPLLSYCRHMLGNRDEAEDALQQAFIRAHKALLGGSPPRELRPWLYAIARNCCLSAIAARPPTAELDDRTPSLAGLSDQVREREDLRELVADIGRLPEDQRSALLLAELDDLSHQAIATIVGCPVSKVKALIYQARSSLIAQREARDASCRDIREQLAVARGGELRRAPLRRHLRLCAGCRDFQHSLSAQHQSLAAVLPVLPSALLVARILGHGALHTAGTAGVGHAGAMICPASGSAASGASAVAGAGSGITAAGTAGATAAVGASTAGGTGAGALVGGGVLAKVAIGGAVAALAGVGAAAMPHRLAHASKRAAHSGPRDARRSPGASLASAPSNPAQLPQTLAFSPPGAAAQAVAVAGTGQTEAGLAGLSAPGATKLDAAALASFGAAAPLAARGALGTPRLPAGLKGELTGPAAKLSPAALGHPGAGARRGPPRHRLLRRRQTLKRSAHLRRSVARPRRTAVAGAAPKRPGFRKGRPAASPAPGASPTSQSTQTVGPSAASERRAPRSSTPRAGRTNAAPRTYPGTTPAARKRAGAETASPGPGAGEPLGPYGASVSESRTPGGSAQNATGVTGALATASPKTQAATPTSSPTRARNRPTFASSSRS